MVLHFLLYLLSLLLQVAVDALPVNLMTGDTLLSVLIFYVRLKANYLIKTGLKVRSILVVHRPKYKGPFSMDYEERRFHARGVSHTGYLAYGNSKGETRGRSRPKNNSKRVVRNREERNVGTKRKSPKQGLTSAKDLTTELPDGRESAYHRLRLTQSNLKPNLWPLRANSYTTIIICINLASCDPQKTHVACLILVTTIKTMLNIRKLLWIHLVKVIEVNT